MSCQGILSSGPNKGTRCTASAKDGLVFCRRHKNAAGSAQPSGPAPVPRPDSGSDLGSEPVSDSGSKTWATTGSCSHMIAIDPDKPIYAYDFDDTLVRLRTATPLPGRLDTLREQAKTHNIVVFSNQAGVSKGKTTHPAIRGLMESFMKLVGIKMSFLYATEDDIYRKPATGMADLLGLGIDYYCGDAAGRKGDFSISDLYFANNIGVKFVTPEQVFSGATYMPPMKHVNYPEDVWSDGYQVNDYKLMNVIRPEDAGIQESHVRGHLVLMVGPQACGKSTLSRFLSEKYGSIVINGDKLKTEERMKAAFRSADTSNGIIIDNTNTKKKTRDYWYSMASDVSVTVILFVVDKEQVFHLTRYREAHGGPHIPDVAIHTTFKYYEKPVATVVINGAVSSKPFMHNLRYI
jgi:bifunctional polynucleotide phosphatase/kinase